MACTDVIEPRLVEVMRSCRSPISRREIRLISDGRRHAAQQRRNFRSGLREAEDVVDEQQNVLPFFIAEILGHRQTGQTDAQTRPGRLSHLAIDQRDFRFLPVVRIDNARFLHFEPQVVAFARALAHAGEYGDAAVLHGDVVDQFLNDDRLADAGAAEQSDFSAAKIRLEQVDDLDSRLEHLLRGRLLFECRGQAVDRGNACSVSIGPMLSTGCPSTFRTRPSVCFPTGTVMGAASIDTPSCPRTSPSVGCIAIVRTRPSPICCATSAMISIGSGTLKPSLVIRMAVLMTGTWPFRKLNVDGGARHLNHFAFGHAGSCC